MMTTYTPANEPISGWRYNPTNCGKEAYFKRIACMVNKMKILPLLNAYSKLTIHASFESFIESSTG